MRASVLMVPGAFCAAWVFDAFRLPFEAAGFDVRALTLPGHGPGEAVAGRSMRDYADAVVQAVRLEAAPPVLVGHSMGGLVAALAAGRARVSALALLAPSPPWGVQGASLDEAAAAVVLYGLGPFWASSAIAPDLATARAYSLEHLPEAQRRQTAARLVPESGRALFETLNWWLDPMAATRLDVGAIAAPVLVVAGSADRIHPLSTVQRTAALLGAELQVMDGMGHWLVGEPGWDDGAARVLAWLSRLA